MLMICEVLTGAPRIAERKTMEVEAA